jgi:hypothetical protein
MLKETKILNINQLSSTREMVVPIKDGRLSISMKRRLARTSAVNLEPSATNIEDHSPRQLLEKHARHGLNKAHTSTTMAQTRSQTGVLKVATTTAETQICKGKPSGAIPLSQALDGSTAMLTEMKYVTMRS